MNELLKNYEDAKNALYDHVGFKEDWVVYPISDCTEYLWSIINKESVRYAKTKEEFFSDGDYYEYYIYAQRFYSKHVYRGKTLTMIFCNPHVDGMIWFNFFDNDKEVK